MDEMNGSLLFGQFAAPSTRWRQLNNPHGKVQSPEGAYHLHGLHDEETWTEIVCHMEIN